MKQIVETTDTGAIDNCLFRTDTRIVDKKVHSNPTARTDRQDRKSGIPHAMANHYPSWLAFCAKAQFFGLQKQDLNLLLQAGRMMHTQNGQQLFCEGECNDRIFVILDGQVKLGKSARRPKWLDMGPYGMINMSDDEEPVWNGYRLCTASNCLGGLPLTREACHSLTAVSIGECNLLVVETASLENLLQSQGRGHHAPRIMASLHQMLP
ncbi:MAG: cyclic nucleotide-binding domain-containing protein [Magnetococcales bacterium]|nr:cyclic nucleotide-binding domain-containing protein [Magnetococcales bacterium]